MAKDAEARGTQVDVVTVDDLFPKPSHAETKQWLKQLEADATKAEPMPIRKPRVYQACGLPSRIVSRGIRGCPPLPRT